MSLSRLILAGLALSAAASAQVVLSARAGLIHYKTGQVFVDHQPLQLKTTSLVHLEEGQTLSSTEGRAELVLRPETFLRTDHKTAVEMVSDDITDVEIRIANGSTFIDLRQSDSKSERLALLHGDHVIELAPKGLYRFDAVPGRPTRLRVYEGVGRVSSGKKTIQAKRERAIEFDGATVSESKKFDADFSDDLDRWNDTRSRAVARLSRAGTKRKRPLPGLGGPRRRSGRGSGGRRGSVSSGGDIGRVRSAESP